MSRTATERGRAIERAAGRHEQAPKQEQAVPQVATIARLGATTTTTTRSRSSASTIASASKEWTCDECGKSFAKKASLKGHCGGTGHPFPEHYLMIVEDTPWEGDEDYDDDTHHEEPEQDDNEPPYDAAGFSVPDGHEELTRALRLFGMRADKAKQFSTLMQPKDIYDVYDLMETAENLGWRKDARDNFIEHWANRFSLEIPNDVADEIQRPVYTRRGHSPRRSRGFGGDDGVASAMDKFTDTITSMQDAMMQQAEIHHRERESDKGREHALELRMREELDRERGRRYDQQLEHMQNMTKLQIEAMSMNTEQSVMRQVGKSLDRIGSTSEMMTKWLITGIGPGGQKAPERNRGGHSQVADLMDPEFVEE